MNVIDTIKHDIESSLGNVEKVFELFSKSEVQAAIIQLVMSAKNVDVDVLADVASKGTNVPADLATIQAASTFFQYFKNTFLPVVESAYKELQK